ncbi:hypothetical protein [Geobacter sp. AOG1]|uniref:hypothetical protein n=1 Tax=Geobacter sp. AOG1 TaxID=1566346 RepID=UPI001CC82200|nr:hypothetical protein [Geobacter sp. AOG1]GFE57413.1 hypothetical protein AOG1_12930 [Geobacter sp. AOG1]
MENTEQTKVKIKSKLKKGHGSFWIPSKAVELLIRDNNSSAMQIYTYLTIARHADISGSFSTIGKSGISKKLGLNNEQYSRTCNYLKNISANGEKLLYTKSEWQSHAFAINEEREYLNQSNVANPNYIPKPLLKTPPPNKGFGRKGYVQWVLNTYDCDSNDQVWFHNDLIEDENKSKKLKHLLRFKDRETLARILLMMYNHNDIKFGGVRPYQNIYVNYEMHKIGNHKGIDIYRGKESELCQSTHFKTILKDLFKDIPVDDDRIRSAIKNLEDLGLVYKAVVALDSPPDNKDTMVLYDLDVKINIGNKLNEKRGRNCTIIEEALKSVGYESCRKDNKFYDEYTAIAPEGICPYIVGIFRLKYVVSNSKNAPVKQSRTERKEQKSMLYEWLTKLTGRNYSPVKEITPQMMIEYLEESDD